MEKIRVGISGAIRVIKSRIARERPGATYFLYERFEEGRRLEELASLISEDEAVENQLREGISVTERKLSCFSPGLRKFFSGREETILQLSVESSGIGEGLELTLSLREIGWGTAIFGFKGKASEASIIDFIPDTEEARVDEIRRYLKELESQPGEQIEVIREARALASDMRMGAVWAVHGSEIGPGGAGGDGGRA